MELSFRGALFVAGAFLFLVGMLSEVGYLASSTASSETMDALSYGLTTTVFTLFSGVLIGVGIALASDSWIMRLKGHHARMAFLALIAATCVCVAAVSFSQNEAENQALYLLIFFASIAAFLSFGLSLMISLLCILGHNVLAKMDKNPSSCASEEEAKYAPPEERKASKRGG